MLRPFVMWSAGVDSQKQPQRLANTRDYYPINLLNGIGTPNITDHQTNASKFIIYYILSYSCVRIISLMLEALQADTDIYALIELSADFYEPYDLEITTWKWF